MGRYYGGDIAGKFWFAIQSSYDAQHFGGEPLEKELVYSHCMEECPIGTKEGTKCKECDKENECEAIFRNEITFSFVQDDIDTVKRVLKNLEMKMMDITPSFGRVLEMLEADEEWKAKDYDSDIWIHYTIDNTITELTNNMNDEERHSFEVLAARYMLGTQILRCLTKKGYCSFWCEL